MEEIGGAAMMFAMLFVILYAAMSKPKNGTDSADSKTSSLNCYMDDKGNVIMLLSSTTDSYGKPIYTVEGRNIGESKRRKTFTMNDSDFTSYEIITYEFYLKAVQMTIQGKPEKKETPPTEQNQNRAGFGGEQSQNHQRFGGNGSASVEQNRNQMPYKTVNNHPNSEVHNGHFYL